ncbi:MAG TPA: CAP domain-containing protein [Chloroflexota bacterium]|nr:CAP domain-containing protein [Chloroflexota bacterium]
MVSALLLTGMLGLLPLPAAATAGPDHSADLARELELTNAARQAAGLTPLVLSAQLSDAAQNYSQVLAAGSCFEHTCGAVPDFAERLGQAGYVGWSAIAENIAAGYPTPEAVVAGWLASPGHRANILSATLSEIGLGLVSGGAHGTYWTQEFGSRRGATLNGEAAPAPDEALAAPAPGEDDPPSGE